MGSAAALVPPTGPTPRRGPRGQRIDTLDGQYEPHGWANPAESAPSSQMSIGGVLARLGSVMCADCRAALNHHASW